MLSAASATRLFREALSLVRRAGVSIAFHFCPSQWITIGRSTKAVQLNEKPAAQTSFADTATTLVRSLPVLEPWQGEGDPGFGLGTTFHFTPSQCSVKVRDSLRLLSF